MEPKIKLENNTIEISVDATTSFNQWYSARRDDFHPPEDIDRIYSKFLAAHICEQLHKYFQDNNTFAFKSSQNRAMIAAIIELYNSLMKTRITKKLLITAHFTADNYEINKTDESFIKIEKTSTQNKFKQR